MAKKPPSKEAPAKAGAGSADRVMQQLEIQDQSLCWLLRQARDGNLNEARALYSELAKQLMQSRDKDMTRLSRFVLARMLMRAAVGKPIAHAMLFRPKPGNARWKTINRDFEIFGLMIQLMPESDLVIDATEEERATGIAPLEAAKVIAKSGRFPGLSAKTILNVYLQMRKDPRIPE
ncbi:hypothetical protein [Luteimonas sp. R10]|uniref:hypothetical protein n=1 Tax=Luteimonas sp. R10 TaxID=3108176 RepID=UPI003085BD9E|nr:hypothetical protein U3649_14485 [Luteimonas sp. R10]